MWTPNLRIRRDSLTNCSGAADQGAREDSIEAASDCDEGVMESYVQGRCDRSGDSCAKPSDGGAIESKIHSPSSAGRRSGTRASSHLLDAVAEYLPSSARRTRAFRGVDPDRRIDRCHRAPPDDDEPFAALVFKITNDPFVGHLAYVRVYSGALISGKYDLEADVSRRRERVGRTPQDCTPTSAKRSSRSGPGDIAAVVGV